MASSDSVLKTLEETYEYICTSCAEDDLIKEAVKYCVECQRYCCQDCINIHRRIPVTKDHSFLDNSSVKSQGQSRSLPAIPTKQCSKHVGMIMYMYCKNHDVVCCHTCAVEDHRSCQDMVSVSDNIDQLYSQTDTSKTSSDIDRGIDDMNGEKNNTDALLQQLRDSKDAAIKTANDFRIEMEQLLRKLEEASVNEIENEYKKLETQLLDDKKKNDDLIDDLKNLKQLLVQASGNIAQQFVCSKLAQQYINTMDTGNISSSNIRYAEVLFRPWDELKTSIESKTKLGTTSAMLSGHDDLYKVTKTCKMDVRSLDDLHGCSITGSCIIDDTVLFTDSRTDKLIRYDILSSSLIDYCSTPRDPRGTCRVGDKEVAVACESVVQFLSVEDKLALSRSLEMKHKSYGIAYSNDKLYITDESKSLYMYDMSGNILKTVTSDNSGQPLFERSNHITFNDKKDRLFVGDDEKGLVCFNAECDYIETKTGPDVRPDGVCVDSYGNVIIANYHSSTILQCGRDGQKLGVIVNEANCPNHPRSVCIHTRLQRMFVSSYGNTVWVYHLCGK
ncbi:Transcription intermediary factor 1-alpha [Mactra antiquata]